MSSFRETMATTVPALIVETINNLAKQFDLNPNYVALSWLEFFLFQFNKRAPLELADYLQAYLKHASNPTDENLAEGIRAKQELLSIIDLVMSARNQRAN